jgi:hypothetical protein
MLRSVRTPKFNHDGRFAGQSPLPKKGLRPQRQELIHPCEQAYEKDVGGDVAPFLSPSNEGHGAGFRRNGNQDNDYGS